jgi:hypothetical protein
VSPLVNNVVSVLSREEILKLHLRLKQFFSEVSTKCHLRKVTELHKIFVAVFAK